MSTKILSPNSISRASGLALVVAVAIGAAPSSAAAADRVSGASVSHRIIVASTDISAARRHHQAAKRASVRNAYGSYVGGAGGGVPQSSSGYGYGYGDNSRNQTW